MALRQAGLLFRAEVASTLVITPRAGEAFIVNRVFVNNASSSPQFATFINDTARVGFFRASGFGGGHLIRPNDTQRGDNLLDWMRLYNGFKGYPVVQGENFTVNISAGTADIFIQADSVDAADVKSSDLGGSHSPRMIYVNYGTNLSAISATGYNKVDNRQNPAEMPAFPFGAVGQALVPAGKRATALLMGGQSVGRFTSAGNTAQTQFVRLRAGTAPALTLLDRNDVGYPFFGTIPAAAGTDYTSPRQAWPSSEAAVAQRGLRTQDDIVPDLIFNPNDELALQVQTTIVGTGTLLAGDIDVWVLLDIEPVT